MDRADVKERQRACQQLRRHKISTRSWLVHWVIRYAILSYKSVSEILLVVAKPTRSAG